jgi:hypothetical protein
MSDHPDLFGGFTPITTPLAQFAPETLREFGLPVEPTLAEAEAERDRILERHRALRKVLLVALNQRLEVLAQSREDGCVTADDAMTIVQEWPETADLDPRWTGAVWRIGPWRKTGDYIRSRRRHATPIPVWTLDYQGARQDGA